MDLNMIYFLGTLVESLKVAEIYAPLVKTRKKTEELPLLDTLRLIQDEIGELEIEGIVEDRVAYWINKFKRNYRSGQNLKKQDSDELLTDIKTIDELIFRELVDHPILELSHKGALNTKALIKTSNGLPSAFFDKKLWRRLPRIAKSDFSDSAKCLLTEAPTPATMVGLRGIEAVIKKYYAVKVGDPKKKMLAELIEELENLPNANKKLLGYLDYIRAEKRNLAQHPNKTFTQKEAERIFMEIINAVHDILADIDRIKQN